VRSIPLRYTIHVIYERFVLWNCVFVSVRARNIRRKVRNTNVRLGPSLTRKISWSRIDRRPFSFLFFRFNVSARSGDFFFEICHLGRVTRGRSERTSGVGLSTNSRISSWPTFTTSVLDPSLANGGVRAVIRAGVPRACRRRLRDEFFRKFGKTADGIRIHDRTAANENDNRPVPKKKLKTGDRLV